VMLIQYQIKLDETSV